MAGKGSGRRPRTVSQEKFELNWELTFNRKKYEDSMQRLTELSEDLGLYESSKENSLCQKKSKKKSD